MSKRYFYGTNGNNYFAGSKGTDIMQGFGGNDTYRVYNSSDIVIESSKDGGVDTIRTFVSMTVPDNVEKVYVIGAPWDYGYHVNITGNSQDNFINGNCGHNTIKGLNGNDTLLGGTGNDSIYGGSGNDLLGGGYKNDRLYGDSGNDKYSYNKGEGVDTIYDQSGYDTLKFNDIKSSGVNFYKNDNDLVVDVKHSDGKVIIDEYFNNHAVEFINFPNGQSYDYNDINHITHN